jgi:hypothetical protein
MCEAKQRAVGRDATLVAPSKRDVGFFQNAVVPAGGTSAANYRERELRHILVLEAALGQAD